MACQEIRDVTSFKGVFLFVRINPNIRIDYKNYIPNIREIVLILLVYSYLSQRREKDLSYSKIRIKRILTFLCRLPYF